MSVFKPIKQLKASDEIFNQLKDAIITGKYKAGDKLPSEKELTEMFQASRTAVREALKMLDATSFLIKRQGATGGAFVNDITFDRLSSAWTDLFLSGKLSLPELCEARILIEPKVARMAASNINEHYREKLIKAHEIESIIDPDYTKTVNESQKIHHIIAEMSHNRFLESIVKSLVILVKDTAISFKPPHEDVHPPSMHDGIVESIAAGDCDRAEKEMYRHLVEFTDLMFDAEKKYRAEHP